MPPQHHAMFNRIVFHGGAHIRPYR